MAAIQVFMLDCGFSVLSFFHGVFSTFCVFAKTFFISPRVRIRFPKSISVTLSDIF